MVFIDPDYWHTDKFFQGLNLVASKKFHESILSKYWNCRKAKFQYILVVGDKARFYSSYAG